MAASRAPGALGVVQRFINTADLEAAADELQTPAALRAWLAANLADPVEEDASALERARELREALRGLAAANHGEAAAPTDLAVLQAAATAARLRPVFGSAGARLEPEAGGTDGALGRLVAAVYGAMGDGSWVRLKACARHSCRWAFYDGSRNRAATWCSMRVCGNRSKAERYRRRHGAN